MFSCAFPKVQCVEYTGLPIAARSPNLDRLGIFHLPNGCFPPERESPGGGVRGSNTNVRSFELDGCDPCIVGCTLKGLDPHSQNEREDRFDRYQSRPTSTSGQMFRIPIGSSAPSPSPGGYRRVKPKRGVDIWVTGDREGNLAAQAQG